MKKILLFTTILSLRVVISQTVEGMGVETNSPTETLHVGGTARITQLPENGTENVITTKIDGTESTGKDQMFDAVSTVLADDKGVLGVVTGIPGQGASLPEAVSWKVKPVGGVGNGWINPHNFSDSKDIKSGCLEVKADPTNILNVSGVYLYAKLNSQCGRKAYIILEGRRDSNFGPDKNYLYRRMEINSGGWSLLEGFNIITQNSPIETISLAMPDFRHYYEIILSANNGTNPSGRDTGTNWPQISIYLDELY